METNAENSLGAEDSASSSSGFDFKAYDVSVCCSFRFLRISELDQSVYEGVQVCKSSVSFTADIKPSAASQSAAAFGCSH